MLTNLEKFEQARQEYQKSLQENSAIVPYVYDGEGVSGRESYTSNALSVFNFDMSGSMSGYEKVVVDSMRDCVEALKKAEIYMLSANSSPIVQINAFNDNLHVIQPYSRLDDISISDNCYRPSGLTASNKTILNSLLGLSAKASEFIENDQNVNLSFVVFTDGGTTDPALTNKCREALDAFRVQYGDITSFAFVAFGEAAFRYGQELGFSSVPNSKGIIDLVKVESLQGSEGGRLFRKIVNLVSQAASAAISEGV